MDGSRPYGQALALATEQLVAPPSTVWEERDGYLVRRTPDRPDYHFGNVLEFGTPTTPGNLESRLARWADELGREPAIRKRVIRHEAPELDDAAAAELAAAAESHGLELDLEQVLVLGRLQGSTAAVALDVRPVRADEWGAVVDMVLSTQEDDELRAFGGWRWSVYRELVEAGRGRWWAGYAGAQVVTTAGLFAHHGLARFQHVETRAEWRGRGCASALIGTMVREQLGATPEGAPLHASSVVIIAEHGSAAARLYQRLGFQPTGVVVGLVGDRPGAPAPSP